VLPTGRCSKCGHDVNVDLEIAAFMTPHINRARIVLVGLGLLFVYVGWRDYDRVAEARRYLDSVVGGDVDQMRSMITILYAFVVFTLVAGVAYVLLALVAGKKTMLAFNVAAAIFVFHSAFLVYATNALFLTEWWWWIGAICLGMGYVAARKADQLRRTSPPGPTPPPF
jgi:hypothetical protein